VAGNIAFAWLLTLPAAGLLGALAYWLADVFGDGALGPTLISAAALAALARALTRALAARRGTGELRPGAPG
jgi:hypothetical protein